MRKAAEETDRQTDKDKIINHIVSECSILT